MKAFKSADKSKHQKKNLVRISVKTQSYQTKYTSILVDSLRMCLRSFFQEYAWIIIYLKFSLQTSMILFED